MMMGNEALEEGRTDLLRGQQARDWIAESLDQMSNGDTVRFLSFNDLLFTVQQVDCMFYWSAVPLGDEALSSSGMAPSVWMEPGTGTVQLGGRCVTGLKWIVFEHDAAMRMATA